MSCSYPLHVHETQAEVATLGWLFLCSQILMASACRETVYAEDERCGQPPTQLAMWAHIDIRDPSEPLDNPSSTFSRGFST